MRLVPPAARGLNKLFRPASDGSPRRSRRGLAVSGSAEIPALGLRVWSRDLLGLDSTTASFKILTGGPNFQEARFDLDPSRDREVGVSAYLVGRNRTLRAGETCTSSPARRP